MSQTTTTLEQLLAHHLSDHSIESITTIKGEGKVSRVITNRGSYVVKHQATEGEEFEVTVKQRIANEIAMAEFINEVARHAAATIVTHDLEKGLMIFEDLAITTTVIDSMKTSAAVPSLQAMYRLLAQFHGKALSKQDRFDELQAQYQSQSPRSDATNDIRTYVESIQQYLQFEEEEQHLFIQQMNEVEEFIHESSPYQTIIHGDSGPHNVLYQDNNTYLLDLEFAAHGLFSQDIVGRRIGFPQTKLGKRMPEIFFRTIEDTYFEEFTQHTAITRKDFDKHLLYSTIHWAVGRMMYLFMMVLLPLSKGEQPAMPHEHFPMIGLKFNTIIDGALTQKLPPVIGKFLRASQIELAKHTPYVQEEYFEGF